MLTDDNRGVLLYLELAGCCPVRYIVPKIFQCKHGDITQSLLTCARDSVVRPLTSKEALHKTLDCSGMMYHTGHFRGGSRRLPAIEPYLVTYSMESMILLLLEMSWYTKVLRFARRLGFMVILVA